MMSTVDGNEHLDSSETDTKLENELTSSISSEIDVPGAAPTLTSSGRVSPLRIRPLRDQETQLQELKKENFGLKLRIYHLEDKLRKQHGDLNEDWEMNIQLNVQVDEMKQEMANREDLLRDAKNAIDALEKKIKVLEEQLEANRHPSDELMYLQDALRKAELEIEENRLKIAEAEKAALAESQRALMLDEENRNLKKKLAEIPVQPVLDLRNREVQTEEDIGHKMKVLADELEAQKQENKKLREMSDIKDKKMQELELDMLKSANKMAAMATEHAQQKQTLMDEINELKTYLQQKDEQLRAKDLEISELNRQLRDVQRQLRDASDTIEQLKTRLANKEEECSEKDREIEDLRRRLHDLQREVDRLSNTVKGLEKTVRDRDDEIEELKRLLRQREKEISDLKDELAQLRKDLAEKDRALAAARAAAHSTNMDANEKSNQMTKLLTEVRELRETVKEEVKLKNEAMSSAELKDEMIAQLKKDKDDLHRRLVEAEERILQMTTAHATEKGLLQTALEDLRRQLEQKEELLQVLREELAQAKGENEALKREVEILRAENDDLEHQIGEKDLLLDQAEHTIASLQKALEELSLDHGKDMGVPTAEVARLRALLEAQEQVLNTKDSEISSIRQALQTKDKIITDLQSELQKVYREKETLEEALLVLHSEREQLEARIRELEESLSQSDDSYSQARKAAEALQEQVRRLEEQLKNLSKSPHKVSVSVESTPKKEEASPGSSSTTMIIGGMSENLLLTILSRIEELYREVMGGRVDGNSANNNLSDKMDDLTKLQKHVRSLLRKGQEAPTDLHEALLLEIEQLRSELESYRDQEREGVDVAGSLSVTLDELQRENEHLIHELEVERERARRDGVQMEQKASLLEQELKASRKKILNLEKQLLELNSLQRELDRSRKECTSLKVRLDAAEDHGRRLRAEIMELRLSTLHQSDEMVASSLPDLHNSSKPSDQWAATASSFTLGGDHPDLSELIERHREVTRLNQELQRKCEEKLLVSPSSSSSRRQPSSSGSSSFWQARLKQQEQALRGEMADNQRHLNFRLQQLERQLRENEQRREILKNQLAESMAETNTKEHEIISLKTSLHNSKDKVNRLEEKLAQLLADKNCKIKELEEQISELVQSKVMYTPATDGELKTLRKSNVALREEKAILTERLSNYQEQVLVLNKELEVYQRLLEDNQKGVTVDPSVGGDTSGRVQQLLEEIKALRRQLEQSIRNNTTLSDQLAHKLTSNNQSFDSATETPPHTLPSEHIGTGLHAHSLEETFVSTSMSGATPFVPHVTSTASKGMKSHSRTGTEIHSMGMGLEDKILQLLNSSSEGIDRGFLQELLLYLRQQRRQLNDSQRLLDRLEQTQQDGLPTVSHISVTTQLGGGAMGSEFDDPVDETDDRASSRASSVDLSLIHEQLRRTQQALLDSKSLLKRKHKSTKASL